MKIDLDRIPAQGLTLTETCSAVGLDLENSEIKYTDPLEITAQVSKYGNTANVKTQIKTVYSCRCSRCLEEFQRPVNNSYNFSYSVENGSQFADVSEDIRQELILGYSVKNLCSDDCKGLCADCGANLNQGKCKCAK